MAEIWGAAIMVGGAIISGVAAEKKAKADRKEGRAMTEKEARLQAQQTGYEAALEDYYAQKGRYETQRGLDEFRKFSTVGEFNPGYTDTAARVATPTEPDYNKFAPVVPQAAGGSKGKKEGILGKIDPLGKKLIKHDPIGKKILGGLF